MNKSGTQYIHRYVLPRLVSVEIASILYIYFCEGSNIFNGDSFAITVVFLQVINLVGG